MTQGDVGRIQQDGAFLTIPFAFFPTPETAGESQSDGVLPDGSTPKHSAAAEGEAEGEEGGRSILAEQQRGQRETGEESEGQPGEERQTHRGKEICCLVSHG